MLTRRAFAATLAAGPVAVALGPQCGPTNPPDGVWIDGQWVSAAECEAWSRKITEKMTKLFEDVPRSGPRRVVNIGHWPPTGHRCIDLRGGDPDRIMASFIAPLERLPSRM